jgi:hypothetical protein
MKFILKFEKPNILMGLTVDQAGFKLANSLEWRSTIASGGALYFMFENQVRS